jgi:DNA mismatch repair ATPase MutS
MFTVYCRLQFDYRVVQGPCQQKLYGIAAAEIAGLPASVMRTARQVAAKMEERDIQVAAAQKQKREGQRLHAAKLELVQRIYALEGSPLADDSSALRNHLNNIRQEYIEKIQSLEREM